MTPRGRRAREFWPSGAELGEPERVRHPDGHEVLGGHQAEGPGAAGTLGERGHAVWAAIAAPDQHWHRLPAVSGQHRWGGVVSGDDHDVGLERADLRDRAVQALERPDLRVEVAVLARLVRILVVQEEKVVRGPVLAERRQLVVERAAGLED